MFDGLDAPSPWVFLGLIGFWVVLFALLPFLRRPQVTKLGEASMNFDTEGLQEYVQRLPPLIDAGFGEHEIARLMAEVREMEHDEERSLDFPITWRGKPTTLLVTLFMDDIDAPDVGFLALPDLAERIDADMREWAEGDEKRA
jgi:hypothetical protein